MALPIQPNTTCDIYRFGVLPPAAPATAAVPCYLQPAWRAGQEAGDRVTLPQQLVWTHIMLLETSVDLRDNYGGALAVTSQDSVYIPDQNGTAYRVIFIERVHRNQPLDHKRVYLDRQTPPWPTSDI